ncbi:alcohol dehydrogenase superfamily protein [Mycena latifolia]|nr:alcohol dehydrogenase superfamily protein [Mycena latifolia]
MALPTTTRQWFFPERGSYNDLVLEEVPLVAPKSNEVLVKTLKKMMSRSCRLRDKNKMSVWYQIGKYKNSNLVPCSDMAGEVIAVGADVLKWRVGDRVCANFVTDGRHNELSAEILETALGGQLHGVLTEYRSFPSHSLVAIPAQLSYEEAATLPCAAVTAYNALTGGYHPVKAGDTVLILGTGGVSMYEKLKTVKRLGATHAINYKTTPKWDEEVLKLTGGLGVDRVIEVAGNSTLQRSLASVRVGGNIDLIGLLGGAQPAVDIVFTGIRKGLNIRGVLLIEANLGMTRPVIAKVFPFEQAKDAYAYLESQAHVGKVVTVLQ